MLLRLSGDRDFIRQFHLQPISTLKKCVLFVLKLDEVVGFRFSQKNLHSWASPEHLSVQLFGSLVNRQPWLKHGVPTIPTLGEFQRKKGAVDLSSLNGTDSHRIELN